MGNVRVGCSSELGINKTEVQEFYKNNWKRKIALSDDKFYIWQFIENPTERGKDECVVAQDDSTGEVVGVMGLNSRPFSFRGTQLRGAELTTWIVSEKNRGLAGPGILNFIVRKYEFLLGMGVTRGALPIYLRSNFRYLRAIPRFLRVRHFDAIAEYCSYEPLAVNVYRQRLKLSSRVGYDACAASDSDIDLVYDKFRRDFTMFSRDAEQLRWRYRNHPYFRYDVYCVSVRGVKSSIVVTRQTELPNGAKVLHLLDIMTDEDSVLPVLEFIDDLCAKRDVAIADFFCTSAKLNKFFIASNWFSVIDEDFFQFPHLFNPIELRSPATTSLVLWSKSNHPDCFDYSNLYITKQDADLDRPILED